MRYLALGDSISIDYYTGVPNGGAASQLALKLGSREGEFQNLTRDGNVTSAVLIDLDHVSIEPDVVTLTAGGNDFIIGRPVPETLESLAGIADRLARYRCPVILNTIYDPTDGDDRMGEEMGFPPEARGIYNELNEGIRSLAREKRFLLSDLERLFHGNGIASSNPWIVKQIEPNYHGATAIASHWLGLLAGRS